MMSTSNMQAAKLSSSDDQNQYITFARKQLLFQSSSEQSSQDSISYNEANSTVLNRQQKWLTKGIGFLQCRWINYNSQIKAISYATAFAIDFDVILTCAHVVFNKELRAVCDQVRFTPSKAKCQQDLSQQDIYISSYKFIELNPQSFYKNEHGDFDKDVAVIKLNKYLPFYEKIKFITRPLKQGDEIEIMGYPKSKVKNVGKQQLIFERVDLRGEIIKVNSSIIVHNIKTENGNSGSPILCYTRVNGEWRYEICGIHSQGGPYPYNRGIMITSELRDTINELIEKLRSKQKA